MSIVYEFGVVALCPADGTRDYYDATLTAHHMVAVERLNEIAASFADQCIYQEDLTREFHETLARVDAELMTVGTHSGVKVTATVRDCKCST